MKTAISTILLLTSGLSFLQAQVGRYAFGDSIFVWASSLNMRENPSPNSKIVGKAPYGSAVVIVDDSIGKVAYKYKAVESKTLENGEKSKPYYLEGFWVKVNFDGTVGYVFDGYLSKINTFQERPNEYGYLKDEIHQWALNRLKLDLKITKSNNTPSCDYHNFQSDRSNISVLTGCQNVCGFTTIKLKESTFKDGVMLGFQIFGGNYVFKSEKNFVEFSENEQGYTCRVTVKIEGSFVVITQWCCC